MVLLIKQNTIDTERLILRKEKTPDCVSTQYSILLRETEQEVGNIILINDGKVTMLFEKK